MKIELGKGAKIIGTKTVSSKGQVSGLTEYAGKEVMVVLVPEEGPTIAPSAEQVLEEIQGAAKEHMELAFDQYERLNEIFGSPDDATREFMRKSAPRSVNIMIDEMDKWLENFRPEVLKKKPKKKKR